MRKKQNQTELDKIDIQILRALQEDCHVSYRKLAHKMGVSGVMASARIKSLEEKGLLKGYSTLLDPIKLGYELTAIIFIQTEGDYLGELSTELSQMANVIAVYTITGEFDVVAVVKLKGRDSLNALIKDLLVTPHIKKTLTSIALNVVKEDFRVQL
ncbi:MAG: Lrp/AsnC family transcriptional regulator [Candidatus Bathyarchaeota archaeon]|nr:Lrp/AsnC family transcriptional regulator [Candidatus Bathyarchaeota archaeon]